MMNGCVEVEGAPEATRRRRPTLLLVHSSPVFRHFDRCVLERAGLEVLQAQDPEEALTLLARAPRIRAVLYAFEDLEEGRRFAARCPRPLYLLVRAPRWCEARHLREGVEGIVEEPFAPTSIRGKLDLS
jgi:hypothetical protein